MRNNINMYTYLFGGILFKDGSPYNVLNIEGFHCLDIRQCPENFETFAAFKEAISYAIKDCSWDSEECEVIEGVDDEVSQVFDMPSDDYLKIMYRKKLAEAKADCEVI